VQERAALRGQLETIRSDVDGAKVQAAREIESIKSSAHREQESLMTSASVHRAAMEAALEAARKAKTDAEDEHVANEVRLKNKLEETLNLLTREAEMHRESMTASLLAHDQERATLQDAAHKREEELSTAAATAQTRLAAQAEEHRSKMEAALTAADAARKDAEVAASIRQAMVIRQSEHAMQSLMQQAEAHKRYMERALEGARQEQIAAETRSAIVQADLEQRLGRAFEMQEAAAMEIAGAAEGYRIAAALRAKLSHYERQLLTEQRRNSDLERQLEHNSYTRSVGLTGGAAYLFLEDQHTRLPAAASPSRAPGTVGTRFGPKGALSLPVGEASSPLFESRSPLPSVGSDTEEYPSKLPVRTSSRYSVFRPNDSPTFNHQPALTVPADATAAVESLGLQREVSHKLPDAIRMSITAATSAKPHAPLDASGHEYEVFGKKYASAQQASPASSPATRRTAIPGVASPQVLGRPGSFRVSGAGTGRLGPASPIHAARGSQVLSPTFELGGLISAPRAKSVGKFRETLVGLPAEVHESFESAYNPHDTVVIDAPGPSAPHTEAFLRAQSTGEFRNRTIPFRYHVRDELMKEAIASGSADPATLAMLNRVSEQLERQRQQDAAAAALTKLQAEHQRASPARSSSKASLRTAVSPAWQEALQSTTAQEDDAFSVQHSVHTFTEQDAEVAGKRRAAVSPGSRGRSPQLRSKAPGPPPTGAPAVEATERRREIQSDIAALEKELTLLARQGKDAAV
jgi:hypothetical protein